MSADAYAGAGERSMGVACPRATGGGGTLHVRISLYAMSTSTSGRGACAVLGALWRKSTLMAGLAGVLGGDVMTASRRDAAGWWQGRT